jgi:hypothetical protein
MKKGCFITAIVVATIVVGAVMYIFQNHFDSLILNPGKKLIAGFVKKELNQKMDPVADSPEKKELIKLIQNYSENIEAIKKIKEEDVNRIVTAIENAVSDSVIKKSELEEISQIIKSASK